jgi:tetratricopeptide (TPR) repeat protein/CHAT domain-containing protein
MQKPEEVVAFVRNRKRTKISELCAVVRAVTGPRLGVWMTITVLAISQVPAAGLGIPFAWRPDKRPAPTQSSIQATDQMPELELGKPIERELSGGQSHSYGMTLAAGQYVHVVVDQRGIDVVVALYAPDGKKLTEVDSPNGTLGPEPISWISEKSGTYRLEVRSLDANVKPGEYEARMESRRPATTEDSHRIRAERCQIEGLTLLAQAGNSKTLQGAVEKLAEAAVAWRLAGDRVQQFQLLNRIGRAFELRAEKQKALEYYEQALAVTREAGNRSGEALTLSNIAFTNNSLGERQKAIEYYNQALQIFAKTGDRSSEGATLNSVGRVYNAIGEKQKALNCYNRSLQMMREVGDRSGEAATLNSIGQLYDSLGEKQQALDTFQQSLFLRRQLKDPLGEATALTNIGKVYDDLGDKNKALEYYNQALPMIRQPGGRAGEAVILNNIGTIYRSLGDKRKALEYLTQSLPIRQQIGDRVGEAGTLNNLGSTYSELGENDKALDYFEQALRIFRQVTVPFSEAATLNNIGGVYSELGDNDKALNYYQQSLQIRRRLGDRFGEALALNNIGGVYRDLADRAKSLDYYNQGLAVRQQVGDRPGEAMSLNNIGAVYDSLGEKKTALEYYNRALKLVQELADPTLEAATLNNIGLVYSSLGEKQKALNFYNQALPIRRKAGDLPGEAVTISNIGGVYDNLGEREKALECYNRSLQILRQVGNRSDEAITLNNIGAVYRGLGQKEKALEYVEQALPIVRQVGNRASEALTLGNIGAVYDDLGDKQKALDYYNQALFIGQQVRDRSREAFALNNIGTVYNSLGDRQKALDYLAKALPINRQLGDRAGEAATLMNLSRVNRDLGELERARGLAEESLRLAETVRYSVASPALRSAYVASIRYYYEFYTDLLMAMDNKRPGAGLGAAALQASERGRARTLLDLLVESHADIQSGVVPELLDRERALQQQIAAKEERHIELANKQRNEADPSARLELEKDLSEAYSSYEDVETEIRARSPQYAGLTQPRPLDVKEIQERVLDSDTLLVEYSLGTDRSYLWVVSSATIASYELPKAQEIEEAALKFVYASGGGGAVPRGNVVPVTQDPNYREYAVRLSEMLLAPAASALGDKRLLVVAPGALAYVPFAALPDPAALKADNGGPLVPLIVSHEVVLAPSASVLSELRSELKGRAQGSRTLALLADPVFSADDPRVRVDAKSGQKTKGSEAGSPSLQRLLFERAAKDASDLGLSQRGSPFTRLPGTRHEADQIAALAGRGQSKEAVDFDASKTTANGADLSMYRYVHFATHGLIDSAHPELTGLVLSMVNENGEPEDGFLAAREIYNFKLPAELVVLSACQTALGKEINGEGIVGLARAFMYAGAPRVIASLWKVDDAATAELMTKLYTGILKEGKRPAAALRAAQLEMWKQKKYQAPYYWAAFELQGEWR